MSIQYFKSYVQLKRALVTAASLVKKSRRSRKLQFSDRGDVLKISILPRFFLNGVFQPQILHFYGRKFSDNNKIFRLFFDSPKFSHNAIAL